MRLTLLVLALFYAWQPSGMCACRLQAALLPALHLEDGSPAAPIDDDDDDDPNECHCTGAKPLCHLAEVQCLDNDEAMTTALAADLIPSCSENAVAHETVAPPFFDSPGTPLYLTLRALLI
ncbi:MAG TPA: hypothetical protein VE988_17590 [Gemmataceae bacterium]|nr:hypothetical protein [Gemmataceae bacterium]